LSFPPQPLPGYQQSTTKNDLNDTPNHHTITKQSGTESNII
jgi:hypothetical protein